MRVTVPGDEQPRGAERAHDRARRDEQRLDLGGEPHRSQGHREGQEEGRLEMNAP